MLKHLVRYNFLFILMFLLLIPGGVALYSYCFNITLPEVLKPDYQLFGMIFDKKTPLVVDLKNIRSHKTQKAIEEWAADSLPLRSWLIKLNNQFYYSLFNKSYAATGILIIGKANQLISSGYINSYCNDAPLTPNEKKQFSQWADKIKSISDHYQKKGKPFVYLITPSKAEYMPEAIPERFHCPTKGIHPYIRLMTQLLEERQIPYVNGPQLAIDATKKYHIPMFDRGGIHWNEVAAMAAVAKMVEVINQQKKDLLKPLVFNFHRIPEAVGNEPRDLLNLLNLAFPNSHYPIPIVDVSSKQPKPLPTAAIIGGSFCGNFLLMMRRAEIAQTVKHFSYFIDVEFDFDDKGFITKPVVVPEAIKTIEEADLIILEDNSMLRINSGHYSHIFHDNLIKSNQNAIA